MKYIYVLLITLLLFNSAFSQDDIIAGPGAGQQNKIREILTTYDYKVNIPKGWFEDNIHGGPAKINSIYLPKNHPISDIPAIMHISVDGKIENTIDEFQSVISHDLSKIDALSPFMELISAADIKIDARRKAIVKYCLNDTLNIYHAKAYLEDDDIIVIFTLSCINYDLFESYQDDFIDIVKSFRPLKKKSNSKHKKLFKSKSLQADYETLLNSYKRSSLAGLKTMLDKWASKYAPVKNDTLRNKPKYIKHTYSIISHLIDLRNLGTNFENSWRINFYENLKYILIQNQIKVKVNEKGDKYKEYSVKNFMPDVQISGIKNIQFNKDFRDLIGSFLGMQTNIFKRMQLQFPEWVEKENTKRKNFIGAKINIFEGKWGGFYIYPQPYVTSIEFNSDYTKATVNYKVGYLRETAYFERIEGKWNYNKYPAVWID